MEGEVGRGWKGKDEERIHGDGREGSGKEREGWEGRKKRKGGKLRTEVKVK